MNVPLTYITDERFGFDSNISEPATEVAEQSMVCYLHST